MISYDGLQTQADWLLFVENTNIKLMCIYIYMYSLIEGNNCRLSASPSQHDLGKVPVEGTQCHQARWYMSGYVGSMPNKVLIQTATLYHWIQNPLTELGLVFHEEKNLFQWVNLWNQGKFHLTFLTRSSRIWGLWGLYCWKKPTTGLRRLLCQLTNYIIANQKL